MEVLVVILAKALVHSLWQIALIGGVLWIIQKFVPIDRARIRSCCSLVSLYLIPISFVLTCFYLFSDSSPTNGAQIIANHSNNLPIAIVLAWAVGAIYPFTKLAKNYTGIIRLVEIELKPVTDELNSRFLIIKSALEIKRKVKIGFSHHAAGPCTFALFSPVILLPVGCWSNLSIDELEAIIAHELAHIKRLDALHRLAQSFIETAFYFHPILKYISKQVSIESEHACDDLAVKAIENPSHLATGILKSGLLSVDNALVLPAQSYGRQVLETRISRIVGLSKPADRGSFDNIPYRVRSIVMMAAIFIGFLIFVLTFPFAGTARADGFTKPVLISLKDEVCSRLNADNIYWNPIYDRGEEARVKLKGGLIYMNDVPLPEQTQASLKSIFRKYQLADHDYLWLRFYGDNIKLAVGSSTGDENETLQVYRLKFDSDRIDTFRVQPARQS